MAPNSSPISIIDSHTGGEPTRLIIEGAPDFGGGSVADQLAVFKNKFDWLRTATILEPRGSEVIVGAVLCPPLDSSCVAGVIYFNNVGYLGMCGHGTIGVMKTLAHMGRIKPGTHRLETCVGTVKATLHDDESVSFANVPSYMKQKDVLLEIPQLGTIAGDVAWAGNWFYLAEAGKISLTLDNLAELTDVTGLIRTAVNSHGYPEVDHIELFGPPSNGHARSRNFVLCPGGEYDRSPCGTGTSAKLACLAASGKLQEGDEWIQESIVGSFFAGRYKWLDRAQGLVEPTIRGSAYITAEAKLVFENADPFRYGFTSLTH